MPPSSEAHRHEQEFQQLIRDLREGYLWTKDKAVSLTELLRFTLEQPEVPMTDDIYELLLGDSAGEFKRIVRRHVRDLKQG